MGISSNYINGGLSISMFGYWRVGSGSLLIREMWNDLEIERLLIIIIALKKHEITKHLNLADFAVGKCMFKTIWTFMYIWHHLTINNWNESYLANSGKLPSCNETRWLMKHHNTSTGFELRPWLKASLADVELKVSLNHPMMIFGMISFLYGRFSRRRGSRKTWDLSWQHSHLQQLQHTSTIKVPIKYLWNSWPIKTSIICQFTGG